MPKIVNNDFLFMQIIFQDTIYTLCWFLLVFLSWLGLRLVFLWACIVTEAEHFTVSNINNILIYKAASKCDLFLKILEISYFVVAKPCHSQEQSSTEYINTEDLQTAGPFANTVPISPHPFSWRQGGSHLFFVIKNQCQPFYF